MKAFVTFILFMGLTKIFAQTPIEVKIEQRPSSLGVQTAFEVAVPQAKPDDAIDLWKKTIIPGGLLKKTPKMEKVKDEWVVNDVLINDITSLPLNVITQVSSFPGNIYVRIFLQSEGGFLGSPGSSPETTDAAVKFIREYGVAVYREAVEKELKKEENILRGLENDLNRLTRQEKSLGNKIENAQQDEEELKDEAKQNKEILKDARKNPETQSSEAREELEKQLKSTEKDINKAQKAQSKFEKKESKNEKEQREKAFEIEKQKVRVEEVKKKLDNIK